MKKKTKSGYGLDAWQVYKLKWMKINELNDEWFVVGTEFAVKSLFVLWMKKGCFLFGRSSIQPHSMHTVFSLENTTNMPHMSCTGMCWQKIRRDFACVVEIIICVEYHCLGGVFLLRFGIVYKKNVRDMSSGCKPSNSDNG